MANWAITEHYVYGDKKALDKLHEELQNIQSLKNPWCGEILKPYGFSEEGIPYARSFMYDVMEQEKDGTFRFFTEDAWGYVEFWDFFFKKLKEENDVSHCWMCAESGNLYAEKHNEGDRTFFSYEYVVDCCSEQASEYEECYDSLESVIDEFNNVFDESVDINMSKDSFNDFLDKYEFENDDDYFSFWRVKDV